MLRRKAPRTRYVGWSISKQVEQFHVSAEQIQKEDVRHREGTIFSKMKITSPKNENNLTPKQRWLHYSKHKTGNKLFWDLIPWPLTKSVVSRLTINWNFVQDVKMELYVWKCVAGYGSYPKNVKKFNKLPLD